MAVTGHRNIANVKPQHEHTQNTLNELKFKSIIANSQLGLFM